MSDFAQRRDLFGNPTENQTVRVRYTPEPTAINTVKSDTDYYTYTFTHRPGYHRTKQEQTTRYSFQIIKHSANGDRTTKTVFDTNAFLAAKRILEVQGTDSVQFHLANLFQSGVSTP